MKSILIDPVKRSLEIVDVPAAADIAELIGYDTVAADEIGNQGDRLFFDEDCFLCARPT